MKKGILLLALAMLAIGQDVRAQSYTRGQNVSPAFEGWETDADGSKYFLFGYMNRNWEEELDVPIGPDNNIEPGGPDQGQPTHLLPRRNRFVFRVKVPANFTEKDEMIWTLTTAGKTEKAYATLRIDYFVDGVVRASEHGALGAGTSSPETRANKAPTVKVDGPTTRTVKAGQPLQLVAWTTDDGVPKPRFRGVGGERSVAQGRAVSGSSDRETPLVNPTNPAWTPPRQSTVGSATGLRFSWFVYRGAGPVSFSPEQNKVWEDTRAGANSPWAPRWQAPPVPADGKWVTDVTFDKPGTYTLRAFASDGALDDGKDIVVTVTP
jgi:hypothetical protein